jgi:glycosyltransferase involved in cell wall biosynthesis
LTAENLQVKSMRICVISPLPLFPNSSGATARIVHIIKYFLSQKHEVLLVLPYIYRGTKKDYDTLSSYGKFEFLSLFLPSAASPSEETISEKLTILRKLRYLLPFNIMLFSPARMAKLYLKIKRRKPRVILAEFDGSWLVGFMLKKLFRLPLIIDKHNIETILYFRILKQKGRSFSLTENIKIRFLLWMERLVWYKSDANVLVSKHDKNVAERLLGPKKFVVVVPNGVDFGDIRVSQEECRKVRRWLQISANDKIIVFHGLATYQPNKDARRRIIYRILPMVRNRAQKENIYAVIVGPGNAPPNRIITRDHIRLVGEVTRSHLYAILSSSDVAVVPQRAGSGTRIKILEYFITKVPVVATSIAAEGLPAKDGIDLLIRNGDEESSRAITQILSDQHLRKKLTDNAYKLAKEKFDWNIILKNLRALAFDTPFNNCN